jgi:adenylate cyclase
MASLTAEELAGLAHQPPTHVHRLVELGLLAPGDDGSFAPIDVHMVRLMASFEENGIALENIARGVEERQLAFPPGLALPEPDPRTVTYESVAAEIGCEPEVLRRLSSELGLPPHEDDRIRAEDAEVLSLMIARLDLCEEDELSRLARLYGGTMQRLVSSGIEFFDQVVSQRVTALDIPNDEKDRVIYAKAREFTELVSMLVPWLQRRHREHVVFDYIVASTEEFMEERGLTPPQPRRPPAIAFLDLTGYTALAEERGDQAAAEVAADLASIVQETGLAHGGRPVKWLGDGVMFHFADPGRAILSGLDLIEQTETAIAVPARIGINAGAVVAQEGDYFGRTVNVAARIADYASPREVLVSEDARQSGGAAGVAFELVGDVPLKGVSKPVRLHRASRVTDTAPAA